MKKLRQGAKDQSVDLWAMDEVHLQQYGSSCRMWIPAEEKDPVLFHPPTRKGVGYFGAVRLRMENSWPCGNLRSSTPRAPQPFSGGCAKPAAARSGVSS